MEGTTLGTFSTECKGWGERSRPSVVTYDTERFHTSVYSPSGRMGRVDNLGESEAYKRWLIALWNDCRAWIKDGNYATVNHQEILDRDVISTQRGNPYVTSKYNNPIWHLKNRGYQNGFAWGAARSDGWVEAAGYGKRSMPCAYTQFVPLMPDHDLYLELRLARGRAHAVMAPKIKAQTMGLVFLYELPECAEITKLIVELAQDMLNNRHLLAHHYTRKGRGKRERYVPRDPSRSPDDPTIIDIELTGPAAAGYLTWQLALAPLISDIKVIRDLLRTAKEKYREAQKGHEFTPHHYSEVLYERDERIRLNSGGNFAISRGKFLKTKFHAESWLTWHGYDGSFNEFVRLVSGLVIDLPTYWEAIPFSFVLDYFFTVGKALERLSDVGTLPSVTDDYLESTVMESSLGDHFDDRLLHNFLVKERTTRLSANKLFAGWARTIYNRTPTWPYKGLVLPQLRMPNLRQAGVIAALLRAWS